MTWGASMPPVKEGACGLSVRGGGASWVSKTSEAALQASAPIRAARQAVSVAARAPVRELDPADGTLGRQRTPGAPP